MKKGLIALVMVFCLMITVPFLSNAAEQINVNKSCSLTVRGASAVPEDLAKVGIVIDLYKVADVDDKEAYTFKVCDPFKQQLVLNNNMSAEQWSAVSQKAAGIVLDSSNTGEKGLVVPAADIGTLIKDLDAGLYLMVARGKDLESYVDTNADGKIVTKAYSDGYAYTFLPGLVALPGRAPDEDSAGKWLYDMEAVLKMQWEPNRENASIRIVKTLEGYSPVNGAAMFVFDVEAVLDGKTVYSNVVTMVFGKSGKDTLLVEGIPVGAKVTVTEVYSGVCYSLVTDRSKTVTVNTAQDIPEVSFTNRYNERPNKSHGITNHFSYGTDGWKLEKIYDKTQR